MQKFITFINLVDKLLKRIVSIILVALFSVSTAFSPSASSQKVDTNAKIKAVFIYNFTKYIEWPEEYKTGEFTIGILGQNEALFQELDKMSKVKKVSNQSFSIKNFEDPNNLGNPHILYIPEDSSEELNKALTNLKGKSTLVITDKPGLAKQGAAINFVVVGSRQKFELNKANIEQRNLKVASVLEQLAEPLN